MTKDCRYRLVHEGEEKEWTYITDVSNWNKELRSGTYTRSELLHMIANMSLKLANSNDELVKVQNADDPVYK